MIFYNIEPGAFLREGSQYFFVEMMESNFLTFFLRTVIQSDSKLSFGPLFKVSNLRAEVKFEDYSTDFIIACPSCDKCDKSEKYYDHTLAKNQNNICPLCEGKYQVSLIHALKFFAAI